MAEHGPILEVSGLSKSYGALRVIHDLSFDVAPGEALGVIGPNGAGKTTLFNLITGTLRQGAGRVTFDGRDISAEPPRTRCRGGIARSFQVPQPFTHLSTYENVLVGAAFGRGIPEAAARGPARDALELTGLATKSDRRAGSLTLLERKRLELARAIAAGPKLLLLDEIAGGLTEAECHQLIEVIRAVRVEGVTIIWIEHVLHALLAIVGRIVVIDYGQKIAEGPPDTVMKLPEVASIYLGLEEEAVPHG